MGAQIVVAVDQRKVQERWAKLRGVPWVPVIILGAVLIAAIFAPFVTHHDPIEIRLDIRLQPPAWENGGSTDYLLGTDTVGRDLFARILYGARVSLAVAVAILAVGGIGGLICGLMAGYLRGVVDAIIMRVADALLALPAIFIALVLAVTVGPGVWTVILALSIVTWAKFARTIRGDVLTVAHAQYVMLAKVGGSSSPRIMAVHILPNVFNTFVVLLSLNFGRIVIEEAILSFLGAGLVPPTPSWGQMVAEGKDYLASAWWISFLPGLALALTVLTANLFGDWLRDRLDPKLRQL